MKRTSVTRKMALILAAIVLMTASGCGRRENADKEDNNIIIYKSNENADGFDTETVSLDALTPENIMAALIDAGVVPSDVKVLDFKQEEDTITLDLSKTFEEYVNQMGTAGEYATVGSVVNTYLDAYDAKAVSLLVEGGTWSTGHAEYEYSNGVSDDLKYFYQVQVDDNHNCIVLKEGEGQAEMETSTEDAEIEWLTQ